VSLFDSAQGVLANVLALARTRLELFGTELQEELTRLLVAFLCAVAVLLFVLVGAVFAGFALILSLGEEQRLLGAIVIAVAFFFLATAAFWSARRLLQTKPRVFDASLRELERDYESLKP
jgi:uncharacterized membrane protein YqjE